jgi:hypothetical protein
MAWYWIALIALGGAVLGALIVFAIIMGIIYKAWSNK